MATSYHKVTIAEHDYNWTTYTVWVEATSKNQAMVKAAALAGQEKARREAERMPRNGVVVSGLMEPDVKLEPVALEEYWEKRDTVEVKE